MKHGEKLNNELYFCMYPFTAVTALEIKKLVKAASAYLPFHRHIAWNAAAIKQPVKDTKEQLEAYSKKRLKKYHNAGAMALMSIIKNQTELNSECYLACFSQKKPSPTFNFSNDAASIEIMVAILTRPLYDYVIHIGIQRSICYELNGFPYHPNISMLLHGAAAKYMIENYPQKKFMVTNPIEKMQKIFQKELSNNLLSIKGYKLNPVRSILGLSEQNKLQYLDRFRLDELTEEQHMGVSLEKLVTFYEKSIKNKQVKPLETWLHLLPIDIIIGTLCLAVIFAMMRDSHTTNADDLPDDTSYHP